MHRKVGGRKAIKRATSCTPSATSSRRRARMRGTGDRPGICAGRALLGSMQALGATSSPAPALSEELPSSAAAAVLFRSAKGQRKRELRAAMLLKVKSHRTLRQPDRYGEVAEPSGLRPLASMEKNQWL